MQAWSDTQNCRRPLGEQSQKGDMCRPKASIDPRTRGTCQAQLGRGGGLKSIVTLRADREERLGRSMGTGTDSMTRVETIPGFCRSMWSTATWSSLNQRGSIEDLWGLCCCKLGFHAVLPCHDPHFQTYLAFPFFHFQTYLAFPCTRARHLQQSRPCKCICFVASHSLLSARLAACAADPSHRRLSGPRTWAWLKDERQDRDTSRAGRAATEETRALPRPDLNWASRSAALQGLPRANSRLLQTCQDFSRL